MSGEYHLARPRARTQRRGLATLLVFVVAAAGTACNRGEGTPEAPTRPMPVTAVDVTAGRALFAEHCASCHGDGGAGNGPRAHRTDRAPKSFIEPDLVAGLSPASAYQAITSGVEGTEMKAFDALPSRDRWVLAYFVVAMRHDEAASPEALAVAVSHDLPIDPSKLALVSEGDILERLRDLPQAERRSAHAALRWLAPRTDEGPLRAAREELDAASAFYREGRRREAREALARARTNGVAPIAPIARLADPELEGRLKWQLSALRRAIESGAPSVEVEGRAAAVADSTREIEAAVATPESDPMLAARSAAVVIGSSIDGFALLLLLVAAAHFSGRRRERASIYVSAGIALASGLMLGSSQLSGSLTQTIDGVVSIAAAIALIAATPVAMRRIFRRGRPAAISASFTAFLSAGALVVLFRDAASAAPSLAFLAGAAPLASVAGAAAALLSLALLAIGLGSLSARLSPGLCAVGFATCATAVLLMSFGNGIHALQAIGAAPETPLGDARADWVAFFPTVQTVLAQAIAPALLAVVLAYSGLKVLSGNR